ncbi:hypothetical protein EYF80_034644 [Liparis tanakae]|uniref:Uncharacterized protein n=1 Tax=Liparis tanakae TaxID=230148 RepID=A0A4Z2GPG7_9TELE|nr:hypothetical protein EYF80_034644 [Liparis tanakae]
MSGFGLGMVVVLWHNPVADFVQVHFAIFVQVSEVPIQISSFKPPLITREHLLEAKLRGLAVHHDRAQKRSTHEAVDVHQSEGMKLQIPTGFKQAFNSAQ